MRVDLGRIESMTVPAAGAETQTLPVDEHMYVMRTDGGIVFVSDVGGNAEGQPIQGGTNLWAVDNFPTQVHVSGGQINARNPGGADVVLFWGVDMDAGKCDCGK